MHSTTLIAVIRANLTQMMNLLIEDVATIEPITNFSSITEGAPPATATIITAISRTTTTSTSKMTTIMRKTTRTTTTTMTPPRQLSTFLSQIITHPSTANSEQNCSRLFEEYVKPEQGQQLCNWTWDQFLCWPPTPVGVLARMRCPAVGHGIDVTKFAERRCELNGRWASKPNDSSDSGWTNYTPCFKPDVRDLMKEFYSGGNSDIKFAVAERTRNLEILGLILSLIALLMSLIIFFNFRSLRNSRTKIHKNLFVAMIIQVIIRLTLYLDQAVIRGSRQMAGGNDSFSGIENTPYVCEASYVLLEYARTAMFMWMFIEGLYLHNVVTVTVFQGRFPLTIYSMIGWGAPVAMTALWAAFTAKYKVYEICWWNYNLTPYYWILEGPRMIVILVNFFFLLNIIRVLVMKLRQTQTSDIEQVRKAVRAAAVLLPLLGITNLLQIMQAPINRSALEFALWSYGTHFLTSFQGFFIAMIYCFLNGEVRAALLKSITVYMSLRGHSDWVPRRASMYSAANHTAHDTEGAQQQAERLRNDSSTPPSNENSSNSGSGSGGGVARTDAGHRTITWDRRRIPPIKLANGRRLSTNNNNNNNNNWMMVTLCFRGQKVLRVPPASAVPPESVVFELSEQ